MERVNIYITEKQKKRIQKDADKAGIKFAEMLRRLIDDYYLILDSENHKNTRKI